MMIFDVTFLDSCIFSTISFRVLTIFENFPFVNYKGKIFKIFQNPKGICRKLLKKYIILKKIISKIKILFSGMGKLLRYSSFTLKSTPHLSRHPLILKHTLFSLKSTPHLSRHPCSKKIHNFTASNFFTLRSTLLKNQTFFHLSRHPT